MKNRVLIIGGSSGFGLSTAQILTKQGMTVYNISRTPCAISGVTNLIASVTNEGELEAAFSRIDGALSAMIYCAGYSMAAPVEYVDPSDYRTLYETNVFGLIECCKRAIPLMKQRGGNIIAVSSMGAVSPISFDSFYSSSKAAVNMFMRALNSELAPYKIRCCAIMPGAAQTRFSFKRNIYSNSQSGDYYKVMNSCARRLIKMEQTGSSAVKVARTIAKTAQKQSPAPLKACGFKGKVTCLAIRLLPTRWSDALSASLYK